MKIKDKEIENSQKQVAQNTIEIEKLQARYESLVSSDNNDKLESQLYALNVEKKNLQKELKDLHLENYENGKTLDKVVNSEDH